MMSNFAIQVDSLSKMYRIGAANKRPQSRWQVFKNVMRSPFEHLERTLRPPSYEETLWALRDVSFKVSPGEVVGIIGRNGAGKSTLLKILSRITEPTTGQAIIHGRIGSLLEVGTGFHPELTGRENIFLNGAILGMSKEEVKRKLDEIVDFAEIEKFLNTPIKRYSSGMYVRLAFAVAAHLEPEILLMDEVLAVGDVAFQKKCLGKMGEVAKEGRTVLFVSHNMSAITRLCERVLVLESGRLTFVGDVDAGVSKYLAHSSTEAAERRWTHEEGAPGDNSILFQFLRICTSSGVCGSEIDSRKDFFVEIGYRVLEEMEDLRVGFQMVTAEGVIVLSTNDQDMKKHSFSRRKPGNYSSKCRIPGLLLNEGDYTLTLVAHVPGRNVIVAEERVLSFHVTHLSEIGISPTKPGIIRIPLDWTIYDRESTGRLASQDNQCAHSHPEVC